LERDILGSFHQNYEGVHATAHAAAFLLSRAQFARTRELAPCSHPA